MSTAIHAQQPPGQPQSKAAPTAQLSGAVVANSDDEVATRAKKPVETVKVKAGRPLRDPIQADPCSLPATLTLIQRVLAPEKHRTVDLQPNSSAIEDILPPLTSSNDVDVELYALLAIIVKDFVNTWYTKFTPDHGFVEEIVQTVAHCSRALEQRLRRLDIAALLLDEVPLLIQAHYETYRTAKATARASPYGLDARHIYHHLQPHPALSPFPVDSDPLTSLHQDENERAYRQLLVHGSLAVLLPTEDLHNSPVRVFVGDIVADLIMGQALSAQVCDGWFLHDAIHKVAAMLSDKLEPKATGEELRDDAKSRLKKFGLLSPEPNSQRHHSSAPNQSRLVSWFWWFLQHGYLLYLFSRYVLKELQALRHRPKRQYHAQISTTSPSPGQERHLQNQHSGVSPTRPVLAFGIFNLISTLLNMDACMPWLTSMLALWRHALIDGVGRLGRLDSPLDRLLYHAVETHVLPSSLLPVVLRKLRAALFPNNSMGPPAPPPPSQEERIKIKRTTAETIHALIPSIVAHRYYATDNEALIISTIEEDLLDPLEDSYLNKHLIFAILELVLVRLIPELSAQSTKDLLFERGVAWDAESIVEEENVVDRISATISSPI